MPGSDYIKGQIQEYFIRTTSKPRHCVRTDCHNGNSCCLLLWINPNYHNPHCIVHTCNWCGCLRFYELLVICWERLWIRMSFVHVHSQEVPQASIMSSACPRHVRLLIIRRSVVKQDFISQVQRRHINIVKLSHVTTKCKLCFCCRTKHNTVASWHVSRGQ